jgi:hypothetical protein
LKTVRGGPNAVDVEPATAEPAAAQAHTTSAAHTAAVAESDANGDPDENGWLFH